MPTRPPPIGAPPGRYRTLGDAARDGQIVVLRCNRCRRTVNFLAIDLVPIIGAYHNAHEPVFNCTWCKTGEWVTTRLRIPQLEEYGYLTIRRPGRVIQTWYDAKLGVADGNGRK
ncbi:hypothetical protein DL237_10050 [Pseudooceanicola sediminis]|uniref:Uncharacterized protein n=1 Tax=Pseudooceanicola sediminis TaxID=2211117 RepID=A0A399J169_9RHOB|nr:hypothetical protein DL237_10050 [Pseudooceanicola sediminis]